MTWAVAGRYGFTETEMMRMPLSRLAFWYEGHLEAWKEEHGG